MPTKAYDPCPNCQQERIPRDRKWWVENKRCVCTNCGSVVRLSGPVNFREYVLIAFVGTGIGLSIVTFGYALVFLLPLYLAFEAIIYLLPRYTILSGPDRPFE